MDTFSHFEDIEKAYNKETLKQKFIIQNDSNNNFIVLNSIHDYIDFYKKVDISKLMYHEIILVNKPMKFFLDIDYKIEEVEVGSAEYQLQLNIFNDYISSLAKLLSNFFTTNTKIIIFETDLLISYSNPISRATKFSANIIVNSLMLHNYYEFSKYGIKFIDYCANKININHIDVGFFNTKSERKYISNRLIGCSKSCERGKSSKPDGRYRLPYQVSLDEFRQNAEKYLHYIVSYTEGCIENEYNKHKTERIPIIVEEEDIKKVLDKTLQYWQGNHRYTSYKNNFIYFERLRPDTCEICQRQHDKNDRMYYVIINNTVYQKCFQTNGKSIPLCDVEINNTCIVEPSNDNLDDYPSEIKKQYPSVNEPEINITEAFDSGKKYNLVKAEMKMGKTTKLIEYIEANRSKYFKIIIMSFRRTFSSELKQKFTKLGFQSYQDLDNDISLDIYGKVIIQIESLHRLMNNNLNIDLLIMDEVESIISQFSSKNFVSYQQSMAIFEALVKGAKKVICMDANLSKRVTNILSFIDKSFSSNMNYYWNTYNPSYNTVYNIVDKKSIITLLHKFATKGKRVAIFTNSLKESGKLKGFLTKYCSVDESKVIEYNSTTKDSVKLKHFSNVNKYWLEYDFIIFTPTLTAGVSFTENHFDYVFGIFNDRSCNVETCRQMLLRVRNTKYNNIYITISSSINNYSTNEQDIKRSLMLFKKDMFNIHDQHNIGRLNCYYSSDCRYLQYHENLSYYITIQNIIYDNKSRNDFRSRMISQLRGDNRTLMKCTVIEHSDLIKLGLTISYINSIDGKYKKNAKVVEEEKIENIIQAKDITNEEYLDILERKRNCMDIELDEIYSISKRKLTINNIEPNIETVKIFTKGNTLAHYINLKAVLSADSWDKAIAKMLDRDIEFITNKANSKYSEAQEIYKSAIHGKCKYLIENVTLSNISKASIIDIIKNECNIIIDRIIPEDEISKMNEIYLLVINMLPALGISDDCKSGKIEYLDFCIYIGKILNQVYGFKYITRDSSICFKPPNYIKFVIEGITYCTGNKKKSKYFPIIEVGYC